MALAKGGEFLTNTIPGPQIITGLGFRPDLVLFFTVFRQTRGGDTSNAYFSWGAFDGVRQWAQAWASQDAVSPTNCASHFDDTLIAAKVDPSAGASPVEISGVSFTDDGFQINIDVTDGMNYLVGYFAWGNVDAYVDNMLLGGAGTQAETGVGFLPEAVCLFGMNASTVGVPQSSIHASGGMDDAITPVSSQVTSGDNRTSNAAWGIQSSIYSVITLNQVNGNVTGAGYVDSLDADGFTMQIDNGFPNGTQCGYFCIRGVRVKTGAVQHRATTGTLPVTGVGFTPDMVWLIHGNQLTEELVYLDAWGGFAAGSLFESVIQEAGINNFLSSVTPTNHVKVQNRDVIDLVSTAGADLTRAFYDSFDPDGFTLNYQEVQGDSRYFGYAALQGYRIAGTASMSFDTDASLAWLIPIVGSSNIIFTVPPTTLRMIGELDGGTTFTIGEDATLVGRTNMSGSSDITFATTAVISSTHGISGTTQIDFFLPGDLGGIAAAEGTTHVQFAATGKQSNIVDISGSTGLTFATSGYLISSQSNIGDMATTFDLRGTQQKKLLVTDNLDYGNYPSYNIDNVRDVITATGPKGTFYNNEDYDNPDINPGSNRNNILPIYLPLDPQSGYTEPLKGNYTVKLSRKDLLSGDIINVTLITYSWTKDTPVIANVTTSGPYSGTLTSTDTTDYGDAVYSLIRTHTIEYPTQLVPQPPDIVSSDAQIVVTPTFTNKWFITINSYIEYRFADTLRAIYDLTGDFDHCVYGSCIDSMAVLVEEALTIYYTDLACRTTNQEVIQKRLVVIAIAWHLLNVAYQNGDVEEADKQSAIIQREAELIVPGDSTCASDESVLVIPCPPYTGGGGATCGCLADNGLTRVSDTIHLGGTLIKNTVINTSVYALTMQGAAAGTSYSLSMAYNTGLQMRSSDANTEGLIAVGSDLVMLERIDLITAANTRAYTIGTQGLSEQADYSATYGDRTLVSNEYVLDTFLLSAPGSFQAYPDLGDPEPLDLVLLEDSGDGYTKKKATLVQLASDIIFTDLLDTPPNYIGSAGLLVRVNATEDGVIFETPSELVAVDVSDQYTNASGGQKVTLDDIDRVLIENSLSGYEKQWANISDIRGVDSFLALTDTPSSYAGQVGNLLAVNGAGDALEFIITNFVPDTGGTFTGAVTIQSATTTPFILKRTSTGAGEYRIQWIDNLDIPLANVGLDPSGNLEINALFLGALVRISPNLDVQGNITLTGIVDGVDIAGFRAEYDTHTHDFTTGITGKPTTLAGYGITDAMLNTAGSWATEFVEKGSGQANDRVVIEDSLDGYIKKWVQVQNLPGGGASSFIALLDTPVDYVGSGGYGIKVTGAEDGLEFIDIDSLYVGSGPGYLNALAPKALPVDTDILLIEDVFDSYTQKKIAIGDIPIDVSGVGFNVFAYTFSTATADADPGAGNLRFNNGVYADVTFLYASTVTNYGLTLTLETLKANDVLIIQQVSDPERTGYYFVTADPIDAGAYFKIPVVYFDDAGGGLILNNQEVGAYFREFVKDFTFTDSLQETLILAPFNYDVNLIGDVANPGANAFYGTDGAGAKGWVSQPTPLLHASTHASGGTDQVDHDTLLNYVAGQHIRWDQTGLEDINADRIDGVAVLLTTAQTVNGIKTWNDDQIFMSGVLFGDADTGFTESADDVLEVQVAGSNVFRFTSDRLRTALNGGAALLNETTSATNPVIVLAADLNTGLGSPGADQLSLIAGAIEGLRVDESTAPGFVRTWLNPDGAIGADTGLWFGAGGNTGFYESSDNSFTFTFAGSDQWNWSGVQFGGRNTADPILRNTAITSTSPAFSFLTDETTGIGRASAGNLSIIASGVEAARFGTTLNTLSNRTQLDELLMSAGITPAAEPGGLLWWNDEEYTLNISTGLGPVLQSGQEIYLLIYNDSGAQLDNFTTLRPKAGFPIGSIVLPTVQKTDSSTWIGVEGTLMVATMDIPNGQVGLCTRFGRARGGDASGTSVGETWNLGDQLYISEIPGQLTNVRPEFPAYNISMGGVVDNSAAPDGEVFVSFTRNFNNTFDNFWNGTIRETFEFTVTESGGTVTGHLDDAEGDASLTYLFESGFYIVDTSSSIDVTLTPGTDTAPVTNYVYILESTKALTVSTTNWPSEEHIKVSLVVLQSAATTGTDGALRNQNWNDHIQGLDGQGHLSHITSKLRKACEWISGVETTITLDTGPTPDDVWISTTSGVVLQLHEQAFPSFDTETGDSFRVVNHWDTPYTQYNNINFLTDDTNGNSLNNTSFSIVLWGIINSGTEPSFLMVNLPAGSYAFNTPENAVSDALNYSVYDIPSLYTGVAFLISRITLTYKNDEWVVYDEESLLGKIPNAVAGGGGGGGAGASTFLGLTDTPATYIGEANKVYAVNVPETALEAVSDLVLDSITLAGGASPNGLWFGDGDTGFYQPSDDLIRVWFTGGTSFYNMTAAYMGGGLSAGARVGFNTTTSATIPNLNPRTNDADTGIGSRAVDQLSLIAGALEGIRIDEVTTPGATNVLISPARIGADNGIWLSNSSTKVYVDGTGNLTFEDAISGTQTLADLVGGGAALWTQQTGYIEPTNTGNNIRLQAELQFGADGNTAVYEPSEDNLTFKTGGNDRMVIADDGLVGIGITDPTDLLHLYSVTTDRGIVIQSFTPSIKLVDIIPAKTGYQFYMETEDLKIKQDSNGDGVFENTLMVFDKTGNIGIGTEHAGEMLEIARSSSGGKGGVIRLTNFNPTLEDNAIAGEVEFYNDGTGGGGPVVVSRIYSVATDASAGDFDLTFYDTVTGTKTLAELAAGGGGATYWARSGTELSPDTAGDDILMKDTEKIKFNHSTTYFTGPDGGTGAISVYVNSTLVMNWSSSQTTIYFPIVAQNNQNLGATGSAQWFGTVYAGRFSFEALGYYIDTSGTDMIFTDGNNTDVTLSSLVAGGTAYGTNNQVPRMNSLGTAFEYDDNFVFDGTNLGVGTATPQEKVHISGTGSQRLEIESLDTSSSVLKLTNTEGSFSIFTLADKFQINDNTDAATRITLDGDGNVGIGTTSPNNLVELSGTVTSKLSLRFDKNALAGGEILGALLFSSNDGNLNGTTFPWDIARIEAESATGSSGSVGTNMKFFTNENHLSTATERMRIDNVGNVGIGTTAPDALLDLSKSVDSHPTFPERKRLLKITNPVTFGTAEVGLQLRTVTTNGPEACSWDIYTNGLSGTLAFSRQDGTDSSILGSQYMTISKDGNVGIGTAVPSSKLEVNGTISIGRAAGGYVFNETVGGSSRAGMHSNASNDLILKVNNNITAVTIDGVINVGWVGIGNTTPQSELDIKSTSDTSVIVRGAVADSAIIDLLETDFGNNTFGSLNAWGFRFEYEGNENKFYIKSGAQTTVLTAVTILRDSGNVGIGETVPLSLLHCDGDIRIATSDTNALILARTTTALCKINSLAGDLSTRAGITFSTTNKTNALNIVYGGNVGIGTSTPAELLSLYTSGTNATFSIERADLSRPNIWKFSVTGVAAGAADLFIKPTGKEGNVYFQDFGGAYTLSIDNANNRVGIGEIAPAYNLEITGTASAVMQLTSDNTGLCGYYFGDTDLNGRGRILYDHSADSMELWTSSGRRITIDNAGNVGIGTTSPAQLLHLHKSSALAAYQRFTNSNNTSAFDIGVNTAGDGVIWNRQAGSYLAFATQGSERIRILSGGNVGIGLTNPTGAKLVVDGGTGPSIGIVRTSGQPSIKAITDAWMFIDSNTGYVSLNHYVSDDVALCVGGGDVGVGNSTPSFRLDVSGTGRFTSTLHAGAIHLGSQAPTAKGFKLVTNNGADELVSFETDSSDIRFKDAIKPIVNATKMLLGLEGITFQYNALGHEITGQSMAGRRASVIAQDLLKVNFIEAVSEIADTGYYDIDDRAVVALLVEGFKEQQKEITRLKTKLNKLKNG